MYSHHSLTKNAVDTAVYNWKHNIWPNTIISNDVYQTLASQNFPAPDSMLYDPINEHSIAIEFKPPTENKRGILTGVGQGISYLVDSSFAYLFTPSILEGFQLEAYLRELFANQITGKIPMGLICYDDEQGKNLKIVVEVDAALHLKHTSKRGIPNRYWAKHIDMPNQLLWIILDIAYSLPEQENRREAVWRTTFDKFLFPPSHRQTLDVMPTNIVKHDGMPLYILDRVKRKLKRKVDSGELSYADALVEIDKKIKPDYVGDNYYNSYRKNFITFFKHLQLIDNDAHLTEPGLLLHRVGMIHKPTSETFNNYFGHILLFNGKHLELILDVEKLTRNQGYPNIHTAIAAIKADFLDRGLYRENPGRRVHEETEPFLKYEKIIWGHLGILNKIGGSQYVPERGFAFDWDQVTRLCSLD